MRRQPIARYRVNCHWQIVEADAEFCRLLRGSKAALIGRDVRELLRRWWQWRGHAPHLVWDAELEQLARAS
jgi:hypothetical protein